MKKNKVLVWGDCILDQYWSGKSTRISPEAPVPIVNINDTNMIAGGAANVALNLSSLGMDVTFVALIGNDRNGDRVSEILESNNISLRLIKPDNYKTITKLRIYSSGQQMIRADFEDTSISPTEDDIKKILIDGIEAFNYLVISDYQKGSIKYSREVIKAAKSHGLEIIVDPKGKSFDKYYGASFITPNLKELEEFVGDISSKEILRTKLKSFAEDINCKGVILTMSEKGILYYENGEFTDFPTNAQEVYDVTGAGDVVISSFTKALSCNKDNISAVKIANKIAGISVKYIGNFVASLDDFDL